MIESKSEFHRRLNRQFLIQFIITMVTVTIVMTFIFTVAIPYKTHIDAVKSQTDSFGYASYEIFKREYDEHDWGIWYIGTNALEDYETDSGIDSFIIRFDGKGMIMNNIFDYMRVQIFRRQMINHIENVIIEDNREDWEDE